MTIYLIPLRKLVIVIVAALKSPQLRCLSVSELIVDNLFCNLFRYLDPAHLCCRIRIWIISSGYSFVRYYLMIIAIMVKKKKIQKKTFFSLKKIYFTFLCHVTFTFSYNFLSGEQKLVSQYF